LRHCGAVGEVILGDKEKAGEYKKYTRYMYNDDPLRQPRSITRAMCLT
jgi:hypothetical protein